MKSIVLFLTLFVLSASCALAQAGDERPSPPTPAPPTPAPLLYSTVSDPVAWPPDLGVGGWGTWPEAENPNGDPWWLPYGLFLKLEDGVWIGYDNPDANNPRAYEEPIFVARLSNVANYPHPWRVVEWKATPSELEVAIIWATLATVNFGPHETEGDSVWDVFMNWSAASALIDRLESVRHEETPEPLWEFPGRFLLRVSNLDGGRIHGWVGYPGFESFDLRMVDDGEWEGAGLVEHPWGVGESIRSSLYWQEEMPLMHRLPYDRWLYQKPLVVFDNVISRYHPSVYEHGQEEQPTWSRGDMNMPQFPRWAITFFAHLDEYSGQGVRLMVVDTEDDAHFVLEYDEAAATWSFSGDDTPLATATVELLNTGSTAGFDGVWAFQDDAARYARLVVAFAER